MAERAINVEGGNVQIGDHNNQYITTINNYILNESPFQLINDRCTVIAVYMSWIPGAGNISPVGITIIITVRNEAQAEAQMSNDYEDNPDFYQNLTRQMFGGNMGLDNLHRGSVIFEIKSDNFETISSLATALKEGTFKQFLKELFMHDPIFAAIEGKTLDVSVQFGIPKQLIEFEEYIRIAKAAVKDIIELDKQERRQKTRTSRRFREVADVIERAERDENRRRRNAAAATAGIAAGLALLTFGASLAVGAVSTGLVGLAALTVGAVVYDMLKSNPVQESAEESRKEYVEAVSEYRKALNKVTSLKLRDNPEVIRLLDEIDEPRRVELLRSYLQDPSSVRVKDGIKIQIDQETFFLEKITLLALLKYIFNLGSDNVQHTRDMATEIQNFEIFEER